MSPTATGVPVIDISGLRGAGRSEIVGALARAHRTVGFSQILGHGIPGEALDALFDASRTFEALPLKERRQLALDHLHRGFIEIDTSVDRHSSIETATRPNQSESFMVMREAGPDDPEVVAGTLLAGPNQWPDLPGFRAAVEHYQRCVEAVATDVLAALAEGLGDDGALLSAFDRPTTWLRLLHYPPVAPNAPGDLYGSAPHVDYGGVTLLTHDGTPGLEVLIDGRWTAVEPVEGAIVVNCGQMLERASNGRLLPTAHRVHNRGGTERWSAAFFLDPHVDTVIAPVPCCVDETDPPRFEPVVFGDVVRAELGASFELHAGLIDR